MSSSTVLVILLFISLHLVSSNNFDQIYNSYVNEVINFKELKKKINVDLGDLEEGQMVASKMLDASTKIPNGLLQGNFFDLGNFDECYGIKYQNIYGKYCLGTLSSSNSTQKYFDLLGKNNPQNRQIFRRHPELRPAGMGTNYNGLHFAACVPSNWSASDIPGLLTYTEDMCYSKATEPELSGGAIATITVLSIFLAIIVSSTAFDIFLYYTKRDPPHELLIAFSFLSNGREVFRSSSNSDQLLCLNGIRTFSVMWMIIGHVYSLELNAPLSNVMDIINWEQDPENMSIMEATTSVDIFLTVGGLVTVYTFLKSMDRGVKFNVILYYINRYLRLTPVIVIMVLIHLYLLNYVGKGPLWYVVDFSLVKTCEQRWWSTFLYIANYYVQKGSCLPQTWFISIEMQLFILSPIVLIPLHRWPKIGLVILGILSVAGCAVPFAIGYSQHLGSMTNSTKYMNYYYIQTYARFGPYVLGMILGYFLYKMKTSQLRISIPKLAACALWLIFLTGLVSCVYAGFPLYVAKTEDRWGNSMFLAFNRPAWAVALSGIIFLCVAGYGGPVDKFLSLPIFQILPKLSHCMYLVHDTVIIVRYGTMKTNISFSDWSNMHAFWGDFIFSLVLSLLLCLSFESPIIILEKYLFGRDAYRKKEETREPEV